MKKTKTVLILAAVTGALLLGGCGSEKTKIYEQAGKDLSQGSYKYALEEYQSSIQNGVKLAQSYRGAGIASLRLGKYEDAVNSFTEALNCDKVSKSLRKDILSYRATAELKSGKYEDAMADCQTLGEDFSMDAGSYFLTGKVALAMDSYEEAASNFKQAYGEDSTYDMAIEIYEAYLDKDMEADGTRYLEAALSSEAKDAQDHCDRGRVYYYMEDYSNAKKELLEASKKDFEEKVREEKMKAEVIDVTLPAKKNCVGHRHPNTIALEEVERVFTGMGYEVVEGPEIEYDEYNFRKLNIPDGHPAKDEQDTFYINKDIVLRTQTSPVQARIMEQGKLPICILSPGRVFRSDEVDATHSPSFHQIEGLIIDKNISFADLKGTLEVFAKELFGEDTKTKFRPHHFPFTEPSAEMDVSCFKCGGKGCRFCKGSGWIEILGCGMVHPHVLEMCGIDPEEYTGFAFGVGLERIALLKYEIDDMRLLYENDIRFLKQF